MADLTSELRELMKVAKRENYTEAQKVLAGHLKDIRDERLRRPWPLGRCVWCEIDANRLREAVEPDPGGGPAMCEQHARAYYDALEKAG